MKTFFQPDRSCNPVLEPNTQVFLDRVGAEGGPQIHEMSVESARDTLSELQAGDIPKLSADIEDCTIPAGPSGGVVVRIIRPKGAKSALPVVVYFHGGGWVLGDAETHDRLLRELANGAGAAVVFVEYSRSPAARFPTAIEEAYAVTQWIAENGAMLNVDSTRIAVAGDSVGGNMAIAVTLMAKERGGPQLCFQVLFYPVTDSNFETASYHQFGQGYFLTREAMKWFWDQYIPDIETRNQAKASPLTASIEQLRGLPPALLIISECDVLRDEGEAFASRLMEAEVPVTAMRFLGTIHDFVMLNAIAETPAARCAVGQANAMLRKAFTLKNDDQEGSGFPGVVKMNQRRLLQKAVVTAPRVFVEAMNGC